MNDRRPVIGSFASLIQPDTSKKSTEPEPPKAIDILLLVSQASGTIYVAALLERSGLRLDQLGELLNTLKKADFIEMSGDWGKELVSITKLGETVVQTAKPEPF